jgi:phage repressor protein C with HTH and peptisase S24 domain
MKSIKEIRRENLKFLVEQAGSRSEFVNNEKAEKLNLTYGYVGSLINGHSSFGDSAARKIEKLTGKPENWLDVPHPELWGGDVDEIDAYDNYIEAAENTFEIASHDDVAASMGGGVILNEQPGQITSITVNTEWADKNIPANTGKQNIKIITGFGDSMKPLFMPGDPLLIDIGVKTCNHDGIYFFRVGNEGFVKRLQRIPGQGIRAISVNPSYESWTITEDMDFEVFGKVLTAWSSTLT